MVKLLTNSHFHRPMLAFNFAHAIGDSNTLKCLDNFSCAQSHTLIPHCCRHNLATLNWFVFFPT